MELTFNKIEEAVTVLSSHPDGKKFLDMTLDRDNMDRVSFIKTCDDKNFMETVNSPLVKEFDTNFQSVVKEVKENLGKPVLLVNDVVGELVGFKTTRMDHYYVVRKLRHQCTVNNVKKYKRTKELTTITACAPLFYIDQKEIIITK